MMKKSRRVLIEPSPSPSSSNWFPVQVREGARVRFNPSPAQGGEEARAQFKHQALLQDYEELLRETEAKKEKLNKTIQKKLKFVAEIKFLRRKYESFLKNPTQETPYRLKKQLHRVSSPSDRIAQPQNPVNLVSIPSKDTKQIVKGAALSRPSGLFDLNQISLPSAEEMQVFPNESSDESKRLSMEGGAVTNSFKRSVVQDVGIGSSKDGKRKISWQDQVALRA